MNAPADPASLLQAAQAAGHAVSSAEVWATVLQGRHAGASMPVLEGTLLVGSALHADMLLTDAGVAGDHALISLGGGILTVRALDGELAVDGPLGEASIPAGRMLQVPPGTQLRLGNAWLGLAARDHDWAAAGPADAAASGPGSAHPGSAHPGSAHPAASDSASPVFAASSRISATRASGGQDASTAFAAGATAAVASSGAPAATGASRWRPILIGAALALAAVTVLLVGGHRAGLGDQRLADVQARIAQLPGPGSVGEVTVSQTPDGQLVVGGYVPDASTRLALQRVASESQAINRVFVADELVRYATDLLRGRGHRGALDIRYGGAGSLRVAGVDTTDGRLLSDAQRLVGEIPGVRTVHTDIVDGRRPAPPPAPAEAPANYVLGGVSGINASGAVPYMSSGNSYIFHGGTLKNGMTVIAIDGEKVLVDDHGTRRTSEVIVR